ncbi:MAG TPA: DUF2520 domain-containing protein [Acidimicrobiia bacterium]|nr:DUF2520 domain-containing protein [Acidimicrobiia bacterium]
MPATGESMRLMIVGPGRAGGSIAIAATRVGHEISGVISRSGVTGFGPLIPSNAPLPESDLLLIAVRDEAIAEVAEELADRAAAIAVAAHLSGFVPLTALRALADAGLSTGAFHPLQTLPDPERGAAALAGSYVGIDGDAFALDTLTHLASSLGMEPFRLDDTIRPAYHAAAAAASNFVVTALATAGDLFDSAGVDPRVARPLVERAVANFYDQGSLALTGPIARADTDTVIGHLEAARTVSEDVGRQFRLMAEATAIRAGRTDEIGRWT